MQIKTTLSYHLIPTNKTENNKVVENWEKMEPLGTAGWNMKWCSYMENSMAVPQKKKKKLKIKLPYATEILLLGIYPKELRAGSGRDICTPMFIAALLIIKTWRQFKYPLMSRCTYIQWNSIQPLKGRKF